MEAEVTVVSDADCDAGSGQPFLQCSGDPTTVSYDGKITSQMLCASATGGKKKLRVLREKCCREGFLPRGQRRATHGEGQ